MSNKQAVQVYIRARPTDQFASNNLKINTITGVSDRHKTFLTCLTANVCVGIRSLN